MTGPDNLPIPNGIQGTDEIKDVAYCASSASEYGMPSYCFATISRRLGMVNQRAFPTQARA